MVLNELIDLNLGFGCDKLICDGYLVNDLCKWIHDHYLYVLD